MSGQAALEFSVKLEGAAGTLWDNGEYVEANALMRLVETFKEIAKEDGCQ